MNKLEVEESYDSHLTTIWCVKDGWHTIAIAYTKEHADVIKEALEKHEAEKQKHKQDENWGWW